MILHSLAVEHFRCVRKAELKFGPGLNILHGPNDLGKSSLAAAIRGALLLQISQAEAREFVNWDGSGSPTVELVFESEPQRIWRVRKTFGGGQSFLDESRDGVDFRVEAQGRDVDGRLREILRWGLAPPGGKGGPRGMPMTFLSTALLAEQDRVAAIFEQALAQDSDESGKKRLVEALQAMAEDPLFKAVLAQVQARVDEAFSATGKRRMGKNSPWTEFRELIRRKEEYERECQEQLQKTVAIEVEIRELHRRQLTCKDALDQAQGLLSEIEESHRRGALRKEIQLRLEPARARLAEIRKSLADLANTERAHGECVRQVAELGNKEQAAKSTWNETELRLRAASGFLRWRAAQETLKRAETGLAQVQTWRAEALRLRSEVAGLEHAQRDVSLPSATELTAIRQLERELELARARVSVGLSVTIDPRQKLVVTVHKDDAGASRQALEKSAFEATANRKLQLQIKGVADITVAAGDQDARARFESIQDRWTKKAEPMLKRAGVTGLQALERLVQEAAKKSQSVEEKLRNAAQLEQRAADQPHWAAQLPAAQRELAACEADLPAGDRLQSEKWAKELGITEKSAGKAADDNAAEAAREIASRREQEYHAAERALREAQSRQDRLAGELTIRRESAAKLDEAAALAELVRIEKEWNETAPPANEITDAMLKEARDLVEAKRAELKEVEDELQAKRGALQHVGGEIARQKAEAAAESSQQAREQEHETEIDYEAWQLLRDTLRDAEQEQGGHLGHALGGPITQRFRELTNGRYGEIGLGPNLEDAGVVAAGNKRSPFSLSVGTRDQLSTIFRLSLAEQLQSVILLDDQLTQSDPGRMALLSHLIRQVAKSIQVVVFTCRPQDYLLANEIGTRKRADGRLKTIDLAQVIENSRASHAKPNC